MDAPDLQWHDRSTADSERYELLAWATIPAVVTRARTSADVAGYQAYFEMQGKRITAPRSFTTREDAQEWALRTIERRLLGQSTRLT
jgi:hypothetical protein